MTTTTEIPARNAYVTARDLIAAGTDTPEAVTFLLAWYGCRVAGIPTDELAEAVKVQHRAAEHEAVARKACADVKARIARAS